MIVFFLVGRFVYPAAAGRIGRRAGVEKPAIIHSAPLELPITPRTPPRPHLQDALPTEPNMKLVYNLLKILILVFFLIIALNNVQRVPFYYVPGEHIEWPMIVVLFICFVIGALFGIFAMFGRLLRLRAENGRLRAEVHKSARLSGEDIAAPVQAASAPADKK